MKVVPFEEGAVVHFDNGGGIPIATLNPDTDGDGKIEPWEQECYAKIKAADADGMLPGSGPDGALPA